MTKLPKEMYSEITFFEYLGLGSKEKKFLERFADARYKQVSIPKKLGGTRNLLIPDSRLKFLQRKIYLLLRQLYSRRTPVHGFETNRSPITNANEHQRRRYLRYCQI